MNGTTKTAWKIALATLLATTGGLNLVAPAAAKTTQTAQTSLPAAVEIRLPAGVRATLPRGATTLFCAKARLERRDVLLHLWNPDKGDTTLDVLLWAPGARRSRHRKARSMSMWQRVNRVHFGRFDPMSLVVRTAPLNARTGRGSVVYLDYTIDQVAFAYTVVPMTMVTWPDKLSGSPVVTDLSTETEPGGGTVYEPLIDANGQVFLMKVDYATDAGTRTETPHVWNGRGYEESKTGDEKTVTPGNS